MFSVLKDENIYLLSKGFSSNNITLFVDLNKSEIILKKLHEKLIHNN
jgi:aspartokinase